LFDVCIRKPYNCLAGRIEKKYFVGPRGVNKWAECCGLWVVQAQKTLDRAISSG